jgi:hypothetical protein
VITNSSTLTPAAKEALRRIRALRLLPESEVVTQAQKRAIRNLSTAETVAVALELAEEGAKNSGAQ